jgi:hypothetical protein
LNNDINSLNKKEIIHVFLCIAMHGSSSTMLDVIFLDPITFEYVKRWQGTSYCIFNIVYGQPFLGLGNGVINLM